MYASNAALADADQASSLLSLEAHLNFCHCTFYLLTNVNWSLNHFMMLNADYQGANILQTRIIR